LSPWQTAAKYERHAAIGRFEAASFAPRSWKPRLPVSALFELREDDAFWAARRVAAFTDEMIRRAVATAEYSDPRAARYLGDVLIARRDKVARAYLAGTGSLVDLALAAHSLAFTDLAVAAGGAPAPAGGYRAVWSRFDNATGEVTAIAETAGPSTQLPVPAGLPHDDGMFLQVAIHAVDGGSAEPTVATFRRAGNDWQLVGISRRAAIGASRPELTD
jgi:hypothetical protein